MINRNNKVFENVIVLQNLSTKPTKTINKDNPNHTIHSETRNQCTSTLRLFVLNYQIFYHILEYSLFKITEFITFYKYWTFNIFTAHKNEIDPLIGYIWLV